MYHEKASADFGETMKKLHKKMSCCFRDKDIVKRQLIFLAAKFPFSTSSCD